MLFVVVVLGPSLGCPHSLVRQTFRLPLPTTLSQHSLLSTPPRQPVKRRPLTNRRKQARLLNWAFPLVCPLVKRASLSSY